MKRQKITNLWIVIVGTVLVIYFGYLVLSRSQGDTSQVFQPQETTPVALSMLGNQAATPVFPGRIYYPGLVEDETAIIGLTDLGRFFTRIDTQTLVANRLFEKPIDFVPTWIRYAPDGKNAIAHQDADPNLSARTVLFRFADQSSLEMNPNIFDLAFSPTGDQIYYIYRENDTVYRLVVAKPDGSDWRILLETVPVDHPHLAISPEGKRAILWRDLTIDAEDKPLTKSYPLLLVYLEARTIENILPTGINATPIWSPDGQKIAYQKSTANAPDLFNLAIFDLVTLKEQLTDLIIGESRSQWRSTNQVIAVGHKTGQEGIETVWQIEDGHEPQPLSTITLEPDIDQLLISRKDDSLFFRRFDFLARIKLPKIAE